MYKDLKKFLEGKDQRFVEELQKINDIDENLITDVEQLSILKKYRQTEAYQRLLKRQGLAVKRIERIKETFERKRKQVEMLSVQRGPQAMHNSESDNQIQINNDIHCNPKTPTRDYIPGMQLLQGPIYQKAQPFQHSQIPVHQIIMEEHSQQSHILQPLTPNEQKMKSYKAIEPYIQTSANFIKQLNSRSTTKRSKLGVRKDKLTQDTDTSPRCKDQMNLSEYFVKGINTYLNEIVRNKSQGGRRRDLQKYTEYGAKNGYGKFTSKGSVSYVQDRPQTTVQKLHPSQYQNSKMLDLDDTNLQLKSERAKSTNETATHSLNQTQNRFNNIPSQDKLSQNNSSQLLHKNETIKEQDEHDESKQQTMNSREKKNHLRKASFSKTQQRFSATKNRVVQNNLTASLNKTVKSAYSNRNQSAILEGKKQTPLQSYNMVKNSIIQNIKSKQYWPEDMKHPANYRGFYWSPDYSFCGFATNQNIAFATKQWNKNDQLKQGERLAYMKEKAQHQQENQSQISKNVPCISSISKVNANTGFDL